MSKSLTSDTALVQCENAWCMKWREIPKSVLDEIKDIPWYCKMHPEKENASCTLDQKVFTVPKGQRYVFSVLEEGSLVWVKLAGYPRWPAIICSDIEPNNFTSYDSDGDIEHYHVEYFGDPRTHSWIHAREVEIYGSGNAPVPSLLMSHKWMNNARSRKSFQLAVRQADQMIPLKPTERLKHCFYKPVEMPKQMICLTDLCENQSNCEPRQISTSNRERKMQKKKLEDTFSSASYEAFKAAFCPPKRRKNQKAAESATNLLADEIRIEEKQQKATCGKSQPDRTALRSVAASTASPLSSSNMSKFNQTGVCLLNINGIVVPAILPLDKMNNTSIVSAATGSNTPSTQQAARPTYSATATANGAVGARTSTVSQARDIVCSTAELNRPYTSFTKTTNDIASNCNAAKLDSKVTSCRSSNLAPQAHTSRGTSKSMSQTPRNIVPNAHTTRSSKRDQMEKNTAKGAMEEQLIGTLASRGKLPQSAGKVGLKKLRSPESACKSEVWSPQSQASEDEVEKRGKRLIDVLRSGNTGISSSSAPQPDVTKEKKKFKSLFNKFAEMNRLAAADRSITWNRNKLDMYQFYAAVKKAGGFRQIVKRRGWPLLCKHVTGSSNTKTKFQSLKQSYERILLPFEDFMGLVDQENKNQSNSSTPSETDDSPIHMKETTHLDTSKDAVVTSATISPSILTEETIPGNCTTAYRTDQGSSRGDPDITSEANSPSILASNCTIADKYDRANGSLASPMMDSVDASYQLDNGQNFDNDDEEDVIFTLMDTQVDANTLKEDKISKDLNTNLEEDRGLEADDILGDLMGISNRTDTSPGIMNEDDDLLGEFENVQQEIMDAEMSLDEYAALIKEKETKFERNDVTENEEDSLSLFEQINELEESIASFKDILEING